jgi:hypothetical protein
LQYQVGDGAWLGAITIGYGFGAIFAILAAVTEMTWSPIWDAGLDQLWAIPAASLVAIAVDYRLAKSLWFSLMYTFGLMRCPNGTSSSPMESAITLYRIRI